MNNNSTPHPNGSKWSSAIIHRQYFPGRNFMFVINDLRMIHFRLLILKIKKAVNLFKTHGFDVVYDDTNQPMGATLVCSKEIMKLVDVLN